MDKNIIENESIISLNGYKDIITKTIDHIDMINGYIDHLMYSEKKCKYDIIKYFTIQQLENSKLLQKQLNDLCSAIKPFINTDNEILKESKKTQHTIIKLNNKD